MFRLLKDRTMTKVASLTRCRFLVPRYVHQGFIYWLLTSIALLSHIPKASGTCEGNFVSDEGTINSPNYPKSYNNSQNCLYKITVPEGQKIFLSFSHFQIEKHSNCSYDKVTIYDGGDVSSTSLGKFCGFTIPQSIISSGNKLTIEFRSDDSNYYTGFSAKYNRLSCEGIFTAAEGTISSPNFPGFYNANDRCIYKITVPDNNVVLLTFKDFQLQEQGDCLYDSLKIYDGDGNHKSLGTYCGSIAPDPILSSGNKVTIAFYSDSSNQFKGFSLKFKKVPCDRNIVANEGTISSPNFPSDYGDNARCTYKITVPEDYVIRLTFETFHLESPCSCDYIKIRDGHELSSSVIGPLCGSTVPGPILSSGRKVAIEFRTNHANHYKGFSAKFERVSISRKLCPLESTKWKDYGSDYCYIIEKDEELIWNDALYKCYEAGGSLASFHSKEELNRVFNQISMDAFYIGLRENGDGTFEWADQSPLDYRNWQSGEPSHKNEMCVHMYGSSGKWNDVVCNGKYRYICSSRKAARSSFDSGLQKVCPESSTKWRDYGGNNCYIVDTGKYTWNQAEERCEQEGGHLASFHSAEEVSIVHQHTKSVETDLHIGLQQMEDGSFKWVDKSVVDFLNWNFDEPNSPNEKCSETLEGKGLWNDIPCSKTLSYICSTPKVYSGSTPGGLNMACIGTSDGWSDFGGDFCYNIRNEYKKWDEANNACKAVGGNLASFNSLNEIKRVLTHLDPNGGNLHIGLKRIFIGSNVFEWVDHTKVNFLNWNDGEPNMLTEECSEMYQGSAKWNDIQCSKSQHYICSRPKVPSCSGNVCMNGGVCHESYSIPPRCDCSRYYKGLQCERDVTCDDIPCKNGATCSKFSTQYICACAHGYTGHDCETKILCENDTCENEGLCTQDGINDIFRCTCKHGYNGLMCEEKILCASGTCENGGTCIQEDIDGVFRCVCQSGYQGLTCQEKILCATDTCKNGGTCLQDGEEDIFRCECGAGYGGLTCEESNPAYTVQNVGGKEYILRGNVVLDIDADIVIR